MFALYALLFFCSGAAALMAQLVWSRQLAFIVGASAPAVALALALFMLGLALGARIAGGSVARIKNPLRAFALIEAGGGLWVLLSLLLPQLLTAAYQALGGGYAVRILVSGLLVLPAAMLWGAGLPLLAAHFARRRDEAPATAGFLYGINTLGAATGAFVAAYLLLPALGFHATLLIAALLDVVVGMIAWGLTDNSPPYTPAVYEPGAAAPLPRRWIAALLLLGFSSFAGEVILTRVFILHWSSAVYAFAAVLVIVLIGTALGGLAGGVLAAKHGGAKVLGIALPLAALGAPWIIYEFSRLGDFTQAFANIFKPATPLREGFMLLCAAAPIVLPGALLAGMAIPALVRTPAGAGRDLGRIYFWNTLGNVAGAALTGFLLIPAWGTQRTLFFAGGCYLLAGLLIAPPAPSEARSYFRWTIPALSFGGLTAALLLFPPRALLTSSVIFHEGPYRHLLLEEGVNGTALLSVINSPPDQFLSLEVNGVNVAGTTPDNFSIQKLQAHLPLLLHPDPRDILHIGVGSGGTAYSASTHALTSITIAEIAPEVKSLSGKYFQITNHGIFSDPRVHFIFNDGRNVMLASPHRYDAILSDSVHPRIAGNGSLYTLDYFRLLRSRLNDGGIASMWLPAYTLRPQDFRGIVSAYCGAFLQGGDVALFYNHATNNQFTVVVARRGGKISLDYARLQSLLARPALRADLAAIGRDRPEALFSDYIAGGEKLCGWAQAVSPQTDDRLQSEYLSGVWSQPRDSAWWESFDQFTALRDAQPPPIANAPPEFSAAMNREWLAAALILRGQRFAGAGGLAQAAGDGAGAKIFYTQAQEAFDAAWAASPETAEPVDITRRYEFPRSVPDDLRQALPADKLEPAP